MIQLNVRFARFGFIETVLNCQKAEFKVLSDNKTTLIHWYCRSCSNVTGSLIQDVKKIKASQDNLTDQVELLRREVSDEALNARVKAMVTEVISTMPVKPSVSGHMDHKEMLNSVDFRRVVFDQSREIAERDKRKQSLIVKGFGSNPDTVAKRFLEVSQHLVGRPVPLIDIVPINGELARGKIASLENYRNIVNNAKNLKSSTNYSQVFVRRDLTKNQRDILTERRSHRPTGIQFSARPAVSGSNAVPLGPSSSDGHISRFASHLT